MPLPLVAALILLQIFTLSIDVDIVLGEF
jgi:hypothetical protein